MKRISFLWLFCLILPLFAEDVTEEEIQRLDYGKQVPSISNTNGNFDKAYREAVAALRKHVPAHTQKITVMHHYLNALFALRFKQEPGQYDELMTLLAEKFGDNVLLLASLRLEPHFRFFGTRAGKSLRTNTGSISAVEHDRAFLLKMMLAPAALDAVGKAPKKRQEWFYRNLVRVLLYGREQDGWNRLRSLTPLANLPPFDRIEKSGSASAERPEIFSLPQSFFAAKNDGERLRLALDCAVKVNPASPAQKIYADALFAAYGQMDWNSKNFLETYSWADNEIEFNGRKIVLHSEHDFAALYRKCGAWRELAAFYVARGQNEKAVDAYKKAGLKQEADELIQPYISVPRYAGTQPAAPGRPPQISVTFRNTDKVHVMVRRVEPKSVIARRIALKGIDPDTSDRKNLPEKVLTTVAEYDLPLKSAPHHWTTTSLLTLRELPPGLYHIGFTSGTITSETVLTLSDVMLTLVHSELGRTFTLNDAVTGAPLPNRKIRVWMFERESKNTKTADPLCGETVTDSCGCFVLPPDLRKKEKPDRTSWLLMAASDDAPVFLNFDDSMLRLSFPKDLQWRTAILTDSPACHPGETVRFTLYRRYVGTGSVGTLPVPDAPAFPKTLDLSGPNGEYRSVPLKFDAATLSASGEYKLPYEAVPGEWIAAVDHDVAFAARFCVQEKGQGAAPALQPAASSPAASPAFSLTPAKDTYAPGETAEIRVRFPVTQSGEPIHYYVSKLDHASRAGDVPELHTAKGQDVLHLSVTQADAPNVFLRAFMVRDGQLYETRCQFNVRQPAERSLDLSLSLPQTDPAPGSRVKVKVSAKNPAKDIAVTCRVFDSSLAPYVGKTNRLPHVFAMPQRYLTQYVLTSVRMPVERKTVPAAVNESHDQPVLHPGQPLTRDFLPSACHETRLLGPDGTAEFEFTLPDAVADWQVEAQAVTPDTKTGEVSGVIHAHPDIGLTLSLPQQVYRGETFKIAAKVKNYTDKTVMLPVSAGAEGFSVSALDAQPVVKLAPYDDAVLRYKVCFLNTGNGGLRLKYGEKSAVEFPVRIQEQGIMHTAFLQGACDGETELTLTLPPGAISGSAKLLRQEDRKQTLIRLLPYLAGNGDAVPALLIRKFLGKDFVSLKVAAEIPDPAYSQLYRLPFDSDKFEKQIRETRLNLVKSQNTDGGWGWNDLDKSELYPTLQCMETLLVLSDFGYPEDLAVKRGTDYLVEIGRQRLKKIREKDAIPDAEDASLVRILVRAGKRAAMLELELFKLRERLSLVARSELALTLPPGPELKQLQQEIRGGMEKDRTSCSILENALRLLFLQRVAPNDPLLPDLTAVLLQQVRIEPWTLSARELCFAVSALTAFPFAAAPAEAKTALTASLNGTAVSAETFPFQPSASLKLSGQGTYTVLLHGFFPPEKETAEQTDLMTLKRSYRRISGGEIPKADDPVKSGEVFEVELRLNAPCGTKYVIVRDFLPNGFCYEMNQNGRFQSFDGKTLFLSQGPEFRIEALPEGMAILKYRIRAVSCGTFYAPAARAVSESRTGLRACSSDCIWHVSEK